MTWWRMGTLAVRLSWPHLLTPWRSPLLRWRMETYGVLDEHGTPLDATAITPRIFRQFVWQHRRPLTRFLRWAVCLPDEARGTSQLRDHWEAGEDMAPPV